MENPIVIFDSIDDLEKNKNEIYVTPQALSYFREIRHVLYVKKDNHLIVKYKESLFERVLNKS